MLGALVIVFREVIEAGLIVAIVMAATRGVAGRGRMVTIGVAAGVIGSCIVAGFAGVVVAINPLDNLTQGDWTGYAAVSVSVLCFSASAVWLRVMTR